MKLDVLRRHSYWLLPLLAAMLVALLGARLITLSVQQRSEQLRRAAQSAVVQHASLIEAELAALAAGTHRSGVFWMSADGAVVNVPPADVAVAGAVAYLSPASAAGVPTPRAG